MYVYLSMYIRISRCIYPFEFVVRTCTYVPTVCFAIFFLQLSLMSQFFPSLCSLRFCSHIDVYADYLFCCFSSMYFAFFGICYLWETMWIRTRIYSFVRRLFRLFAHVSMHIYRLLCECVWTSSQQKRAHVRSAHGWLYKKNVNIRNIHLAEAHESHSNITFFNCPEMACRIMIIELQRIEF